MIIQRLAQTGHIAMAENAKTAPEQTHLFAIHNRILRRQITDDGLCSGQGKCIHLRAHAFQSLTVFRFLRY